MENVNPQNLHISQKNDLIQTVCMTKDSDSLPSHNSLSCMMSTSASLVKQTDAAVA
jgi:hypothetical protein